MNAQLLLNVVLTGAFLFTNWRLENVERITLHLLEVAALKPKEDEPNE